MLVISVTKFLTRIYPYSSYLTIPLDLLQVKSKERAATTASATTTASVLIISDPTAMSTLETLSDTPATFPSELPAEEPASLPYYEPIDSPSA